MIVVVCEGDEMERRYAETAEHRDRLVRELEQKYRNCLINVASMARGRTPAWGSSARPGSQASAERPRTSD